MDTEDVRLAIYQGFATTGRAPTRDEIARLLKVSDDAVHEAMTALAAQRHLVLDADGAVLMAHPFSAIPLGFSVMGASTLWWGGCAWDAFALPHLLRLTDGALVATICPGCGAALAWTVGLTAPPTGPEVAHFLVPAARMWDDVVHTCGNQRLFCSSDCVTTWLEDTDQPRGYAMDLAHLWRLAEGWYEGRLDRDYVRRDPASAKEYLTDVGMAGDFWGL
jgi:hypothetical protein